MKYVTLGWDGLPTLLNEDGTIYPRKAELIFNKAYYPNWPEQTWPIDPKTGEKCPIELPNPERSIATGGAQCSEPRPHNPL